MINALIDVVQRIHFLTLPGAAEEYYTAEMMFSWTLKDETEFPLEKRHFRWNKQYVKRNRGMQQYDSFGRKKLGVIGRKNHERSGVDTGGAVIKGVWAEAWHLHIGSNVGVKLTLVPSWDKSPLLYSQWGGTKAESKRLWGWERFKWFLGIRIHISWWQVKKGRIARKGSKR